MCVFVFAQIIITRQSKAQFNVSPTGNILLALMSCADVAAFVHCLCETWIHIILIWTRVLVNLDAVIYHTGAGLYTVRVHIIFVVYGVLVFAYHRDDTASFAPSVQTLRVFQKVFKSIWILKRDKGTIRINCKILISTNCLKMFYIWN